MNDKKTIYRAYFDYDGKLYVFETEAKETKRIFILNDRHQAFNYSTHIQKGEAFLSRQQAIEEIKTTYQNRIEQAEKDLVWLKNRLEIIEKYEQEK
jgi:4-hydroxy-L-threonine phosphate dehydrogenase PdxA